MLLELYLFLASLGFLFFILAFQKAEQKLVFIALAMVLFFMAAISSGALDVIACAYGTEWTCVTKTVNEFGAMILFALLGLICLIYMLSFVFGYAANAAEGRTEKDLVV